MERVISISNNPYTLKSIKKKDLTSLSSSLSKYKKADIFNMIVEFSDKKVINDTSMRIYNTYIAIGDNTITIIKNGIPKSYKIITSNKLFIRLDERRILSLSDKGIIEIINIIVIEMMEVINSERLYDNKLHNTSILLALNDKELIIYSWNTDLYILDLETQELKSLCINRTIKYLFKIDRDRILICDSSSGKILNIRNMDTRKIFDMKLVLKVQQIENDQFMVFGKMFQDDNTKTINAVLYNSIGGIMETIPYTYRKLDNIIAVKNHDILEITTLGNSLPFFMVIQSTDYCLQKNQFDYNISKIFYDRVKDSIVLFGEKSNEIIIMSKSYFDKYKLPFKNTTQIIAMETDNKENIKEFFSMIPNNVAGIISKFI